MSASSPPRLLPWSSWRRAGELNHNPPADAVIVAPMTMNTANKWVAGVADTCALSVHGGGRGARDTGGGAAVLADGA
ncbi:flavoprotein [Streptomyces griseocarneus]|nr:flavoprotein [Streptomyces griseocarneus]